jgi:hypothetical protein
MARLRKFLKVNDIKETFLSRHTFRAPPLRLHHPRRASLHLVRPRYAARRARPAPSRLPARRAGAARSPRVVPPAAYRFAAARGRGDSAQLGHSSREHQGYPRVVEHLRGQPVVSVGCGAKHTIFVCEDGGAYSCGDGRDGKLGHGDSTCVLHPPRPRCAQGPAGRLLREGRPGARVRVASSAPRACAECAASGRSHEASCVSFSSGAGRTSTPSTSRRSRRCCTPRAASATPSRSAAKGRFTSGAAPRAGSSASRAGRSAARLLARAPRGARCANAARECRSDRPRARRRASSAVTDYSPRSPRPRSRRGASRRRCQSTRSRPTPRRAGAPPLRSRPRGGRAGAHAGRAAR